MAACLAWSAHVAALPGGQDAPALVGRLSWFSGEVWQDGDVGPGGPSDREPLSRNWPVLQGQRLMTGPGSRAEIWIGSTAVRLDENSAVMVVTLDADRMRLRMQRGTMAIRAAVAHVARHLEVQTPQGRYGPVEPSEFCIAARDGADLVTVWAGSLYAAASDASEAWVVRSGQRFSLGSGQPQAVAASPATLDPAGFRAFVQRRDAAFDGRLALRYVSPEMTGVESLDSHGRWFQTAQFGNVWVPDVAAGWRPYSRGRWVRIEPWGWTWIDEASWGFAPFHYGHWVQWQGRWAWAPGRYVDQPSYAPGLLKGPDPPAMREPA